MKTNLLVKSFVILFLGYTTTVLLNVLLSAMKNIIAVRERFYPVTFATRYTRNQSYDLRGDPCIIRPNFSMPWNNPGK